MGVHIHRRYLVFGQNQVRCFDFECGYAEAFEDVLQKHLPDGLRIEPDHNDRSLPVSQYKVRVGGKLWCIVTGLKDGVMIIDRFRGNIPEYLVFRAAIHDALGIYAIKDDKHLYVYSTISPVKVEENK